MLFSDLEVAWSDLDHSFDNNQICSGEEFKRTLNEQMMPWDVKCYLQLVGWITHKHLPIGSICKNLGNDGNSTLKGLRDYRRKT